MKHLLVALTMLLPTPAFAALDTNAVAVFYDDATYEMVDWDSLGNLNQRDKRFVLVAVYHVQSPGDYPNVTQYSGVASWIGLKRSVGALILRRVEETPLRGREKAFFETFEQGTELVKTISLTVAAGIVAEFDVLPFDDPSYARLQDRANTASAGLRFDPVPSRGEY